SLRLFECDIVDLLTRFVSISPSSTSFDKFWARASGSEHGGSCIGIELALDFLFRPSSVVPLPLLRAQLRPLPQAARLDPQAHDRPQPRPLAHHPDQMTLQSSLEREPAAVRARGCGYLLTRLFSDFGTIDGTRVDYPIDDAHEVYPIDGTRVDYSIDDEHAVYPIGDARSRRSPRLWKESSSSRKALAKA
ncbi:hypothetical protein FB107DRAFT_280749, partial [Schizophyllum commune]